MQESIVQPDSMGCLRPCQSAPYGTPCLHRLPQRSARRSPKCEEQIESRVSAADGLSPYLLDLMQPSRRRSQPPAHVQAADYQALIVGVFNAA
eukprot:scaffold73853_cov50-Phaeocystis_antarctica.AAC.7